MAIPAPIHLEPHQNGDTWDGLGTVTFTDEGAPLSLVGATIVMTFSQEAGGDPVLTISTAGVSPRLVISNAAGGVLTSVPFELVLPPGLWYWLLKLTSPTIGVLTPLWGTLPIRTSGDL